MAYVQHHHVAEDDDHEVQIGRYENKWFDQIIVNFLLLIPVFNVIPYPLTKTATSGDNWSNVCLTN